MKRVLTGLLAMNKKYFRLILTLFLMTASLVVSNCALTSSEEFKPQSMQEMVVSRKQPYQVSEVFQELYTSVKNPSSFFGKPISHAYTNPNNGSLTQYFENFRFETSTDEYGRISIAISNLGSQLYDPVGKEMLMIDENCTHYGDNEYPVCHEFRNFYEKNNGQVLFGTPISHVFEQGNRFHQYFDNACLIWDSITNTVTIAPLGDTYLSSKEPLRYTITNPAYPELMIVDKALNSSLHVLYSVEHPFIHPNWEQTATVIVTDQEGQPVEGASITVWVILPNGHYEIYRPADTNQNGISTFTIPALANTGVQYNELIKLNIEVNANGLLGQVIGWFRIWL